MPRTGAGRRPWWKTHHAAQVHTENLMPPILAAVEADCAVGEITAGLRKVFGEFQEPRAFRSQES